MAFTLTSVSPDTVFCDGGRGLVATGVFEAGHRYVAYLGDLGTPADPQCYSGVPDQGNILYPSSSVVGGALNQLVLYSPRVTANVVAYNLTVMDYDSLEAHTLSGVVTAVANQYYTSIYSSRRLQPPYYKVGSRDIEQER